MGIQAGYATGVLTPLADSCDDAPLVEHPLHDGFQVQDVTECVDTQFGAVTVEELNPSLIITSAPSIARHGRDVKIKISSDNLIRDRFLAAGQGGYYIESATTNDEGITRGHVHVACRVLQSSRTAPDPAPAPAFFQAVEDGGGSDEPDTFSVTIPGKTNGQDTFRRGSVVQCAAWAGDGSHRTPMMQRANQIPAFDSVRIYVL